MTCNSIPCRPLYMFLFSICSGWQDRELTRWVHEVFLQSLDYNLLPVYLDVLQVLRAKVHSSLYIVNMHNVSNGIRNIVISIKTVFAEKLVFKCILLVMST